MAQMKRLLMVMSLSVFCLMVSDCRPLHAAETNPTGARMFEQALKLRDGRIAHPNGHVEAIAYTMLAGAFGHEAGKLAVRQFKITLSRTIALRAIDRAEAITIKEDYPRSVRVYLDDLYNFYERLPE